MLVSLHIDNVYEGGPTVPVDVTVEVPEPPSFDVESEEHQDWAYDHIFAETGTGRTEGDAGYFVRVTAADDERLVGNEYEWGV